MFNFGKNIHLTIFGQSHSSAIGAVLEGIPAGYRVDLGQVETFMARRAPGHDELATPRKEADKPIILSGIVDGVTCGAPVAMIIENTDTRSGDYEQQRNVPRPMHSDYVAHMRFGGVNDVRGGGQFSGRLTAPLCFAGAICLQLLEAKGVTVGSHILSIGDVTDEPFDPVTVNSETLNVVRTKPFPVIRDEAGVAMRSLIADVNAQNDSIGGVIECVAVGVPAGLGDPMFDGLENRLAQALFAIPAVKGVDFGAGFASAGMRGSSHNDPFEIAADGSVRTRTNNHGGILAGISTGMPVLMRVAFKPTSSIGLEQDSVSLSEKRNVKLIIKGRHDPCIVLRANPAVEAAVALVLADLMLDPLGYIEAE